MKKVKSKVVVSGLWTRDEVRVLRKLYGSRPNEALAVFLGRTPKAVERKASRLGLHKTKTYLRKQLGRRV